MRRYRRSDPPERDAYVEWIGDEAVDPEPFDPEEVDPAEVTVYSGGR